MSGCTALIILALAMPAAQSAAGTQALAERVVIVGTPGHDATVWAKLNTPDHPITDLAELEHRFGSDRYLVIKPNKDWVIVVDRDHPSLIRQRCNATAFEVFLKHAQQDGTIRFGDLNESEKQDLLDLFGGADSPLRRMGAGASDVKLGFRATIWVNATGAGQTVSTTVNPAIIVDPVQAAKERRAFMQEMLAHGVPDLQDSPQDVKRTLDALAEEAHDDYGMVFRYIGVHGRAQGSAIRTALDALDQYLRDKEKDASAVYDMMESRLLRASIPEFGGKLPSSVPKEQMPPRLRDMFFAPLRANPTLYGLDDNLSAERFMADISSYQLKASYELFFVCYSLGVDGNRKMSSGYSVELVRH